MAQKWYQKATVQGAIVAALALLVATLVPVALEVPSLKSDNAELNRKLTDKTADVQRLETQLAPFKTIALERYTGPENEALAKLATQIQMLQELDNQKTLQIEALQKELDKTSEEARPPALSLLSHDTVTNGTARIVTLRFEPSKNQPLGALQFIAELPNGSNEKITSFLPTLDGGVYATGDNPAMITDDGKVARLSYSLIAVGYPTMELKLSGASVVRVSGEYIAKPIIFEVK